MDHRKIEGNVPAAPRYEQVRRKKVADHFANIAVGSSAGAALGSILIALLPSVGLLAVPVVAGAIGIGAAVGELQSRRTAREHGDR